MLKWHQLKVLANRGNFEELCDAMSEADTAHKVAQKLAFARAKAKAETEADDAKAKGETKADDAKAKGKK